MAWQHSATVTLSTRDFVVIVVGVKHARDPVAAAFAAIDRAVAVTFRARVHDSPFGAGRVGRSFSFRYRRH